MSSTSSGATFDGKAVSFALYDLAVYKAKKASGLGVPQLAA
jgi:hypothetical protein